MSSGSLKTIKNRFELTEQLAERSSCKVYLAKDKELGGREVAVKVFLDKPGTDGSSKKLFEDEIEALKRASHQVLVPIVDGGLEDDEFFLALEYVSGGSLKDRIKDKGGPFDTDESITLISKLCDALSELHAERFNNKTLIHGHIDSRAVLFKDNEPRLAGYHPVAIDQLQKQMTSVARVASDSGYISPEQLGGSQSLDAKVDVYALAVLLYEMVCGERPFVAANPLQAAMLRLTTTPPPPTKKNSNISPLLEATILKALARDPKDRFSSTAELKEALQGNKKGSKNPFYAEASKGQGSARLPSETIATSFSTADIQSILKGGAAPKVPVSAPSAAAAPADNSRTMMGLSTATLMRPGFVWLSGSKRGERIEIDKGQFMIGSDSSCNITVTGKEVSSRHALVSEKNGGFVIVTVSSKPVDIGGVQLKPDEEHLLTKGDVVIIGDNELRYLAPGEVFTLKEDGVSHVAAKRGNKSAKYLLIGVLALSALSLGGIYLWRENLSKSKQSARMDEATKGKKREELVRKLIQEGDDLLKKGALTEPVGENALERFQSVLTLEPDNNYAKRRLDELTEKKRNMALDEERRRQMQSRLGEMLAQGELYLSQGQLVSPPGKNAKETFVEVLKIDPGNQKAKEQIAKIDSRLGSLLGQVRGSLDQAKAFIEQGQFVEPEGQNAYALIKEIRQLDPQNAEANDLVYQMAARSLLLGDLAKEKKAIKEVRKNYLTAQALGVDPACIQMKMTGLDLIAKSAGKVLLAGQQQECPKSPAANLDSAELSKRIAAMKLDLELKGAE